MKYYKKLKLYKASNVIFDPINFTATSYNWWYFVRKIQGKVVFNNYRYSVSTAKHQYKMWRLLHELGIKVDLVITTNKSIASDAKIKDLIEATNKHIAEAAAYKKQRAKDYYVSRRIRQLNLEGFLTLEQWQTIKAERARKAGIRFNKELNDIIKV